jgi:hypothetical protein
MASYCTNRVPRARRDPINSPWDALAVIALAIAEPPADKIIAVTLDDERRGRTIVIVHGPPDADGIFAVIDICAAAVAETPNFGGVILASCRRPGHGIEPDDPERWMEASEQCESAGLELVEWFVISDRVVCPRDLTGEPPRWWRS